MPHRSPGAPDSRKKHYLSGKAIKYYRPRGSAEVRALIDDGFQAFNAARLSEACHIFSEKMLASENDTTIGITIAGALTPWRVTSFLAVCALYAALWAIDRPPAARTQH